MNQVIVRRVMIGVATLGLALAAYLTYVHYAGIKPACTAGQACIKVQTSEWSRLDGVPVALIGLLGYIGILISLLVPDRDDVRLITLGLTLIGCGFSGYLTYRELFSIHAVCEECATSAVFMALLFIGAVIRYLAPPAGAIDPAAGRAAANGAAPSARAAKKATASATLGADGK